MKAIYKLFFVIAILTTSLASNAQLSMFKNGHWSLVAGAGFNNYDGDLKPSTSSQLKSFFTSPSGMLEAEYSVNHIWSGGLSFDLGYMNQTDDNETTHLFIQNLYPFVNVDLLAMLQGHKNDKWSINAMLGVGLGSSIDVYYRNTVVYPDANNLPDVLDASYISVNKAGTKIRDFDPAFASTIVGLGVEYNLDKSHSLGLRGRFNFTNSDKLETMARSNQNDNVQSVMLSYKVKFLTKDGRHASDEVNFKNQTAAVAGPNCCNELDQYRKQMLAMNDNLKKIQAEKAIQDARIKALEDQPKSTVKDTDGDGVVDQIDKCPDVAGPVANYGCPEVKQEVKQVFAQAMKGIQFEINSDVLKPVSIPILDNVVKVMVDNKDYRLKIKGHTSNDGTPEANKLLSEKRAKAVLDYLVSKGIAANRLESFGFGQTMPIASNKTAEGRIQNRRVEFEVNFTK